MKATKIFILGVIGAFTMVNCAFAEEIAVKEVNLEEKSVQELCIQNLADNVKSIPDWKTIERKLKVITYKKIEENFSKYYKNMSSFGIDVDEDIFEMRVYSFGKQTGYIHPPYSPFPTYNKTEKWEKPSKEYILAEEYVKTPTGERKFVSCSIMQIKAGDLMNVTSENYLYDGEIISVMQKEKNGYKAWYNENTSYDHNNKILATWKRLFIYPKSTKNDYFDKYSVLESFPGNTVDDLASIYPRDKDGKILKSEEEGQINAASRVYIADTNGKISTYMGPKALAPIKKEGQDKVFALNSYYQAIENSFPEFSKKLALRGILHYDTMKKLLSTKDDKDFKYVWDTVLDTREITKYALQKKNGTLKEENALFEEKLQNIESLEAEIEQTFKQSEEKKIKKLDTKKNVKNNNNIIALIAIVLIFIVSIVVFLILKRKNK